MKEEIKMYLERAEKFKKNAQFNFNNGDHDLAMFHIEQVCQLMIKAKLLDQKGYFERTLSLRKLLSEVIDVEGVEEFLNKYKVVLRNLERAYITSRYYFDLALSEKYLKEAEEFLEKGDCVQASEKVWGAASQIVKALAAKKGEGIEQS